MLHGPAVFYPSHLPGVPIAPPTQRPVSSRAWHDAHTFYPDGLPAVPSTGLSGLGDDIDPTQVFLLAHPSPSSTDVSNFLKVQPEDDRARLAQLLITRGVPAATIASALNWLDTSSRWKDTMGTIGGVLALASAAASGYHGYRRNQSIGWGIGWFVLGTLFPVITPVIAVAQGFGKRKERGS